jgi:lipid-A-disaccharide synthase
MHLFLSAGEPSGDLHAANLARALRSRHPDIRITGFGGPKLAAAGAELLFPLSTLAVMGIVRVLKNLRTFFRLARQAQDHWAAERPDAVVLIDYPGFNFALAKRAHAAGIPVYYFVPPQIWAWRTHRVEKIRRWCAGVLTALPFEDDWYRKHRVATHYVGHPYFDELASQHPDAEFIATERARGGVVIGLLPGSRDQEVSANLPLLVGAAARVATARPDVRFQVAAFSAAQAEVCRAAFAERNVPVEIHVGRTPEVIALATACVAVSGSVGLELMGRHVPTVVIYRMTPTMYRIVKKMLKVPYVSLVNLLAGAEIFPEYKTPTSDPRPIVKHLLHWLTDPAALAAVVGRLHDLTAREARPGACDRAAAFLLDATATRRRAA